LFAGGFVFASHRVRQREIGSERGASARKTGVQAGQHIRQLLDCFGSTKLREAVTAPPTEMDGIQDDEWEIRIGAFVRQQA
jgi:hypothetical protein